MDVNGQRFWMLADGSDWALPAELAHDRGCLRLASLRAPGAWGGTRPAAAALLAKVPSTVDLVGRIAFVEQTGTAAGVKVRRKGEQPGRERLVFTVASIVTDIAYGADATLYVATAEGVWLRDLHPGEERFKTQRVSSPDIRPFRLAADPGGGCWVLGEGGKLGRLTGSPFPELARLRYSGSVVRPQEENPQPPLLEVLPIDLLNSAGQHAAAIAYSPEAGAAVAVWNAAGDADLVLVSSGRRETLAGMPFPYSIKWLDGARLALLFPGADEVAVYELGRGFSGDYYPLQGKQQPLETPFLQTLGQDAQIELADRIRAVERVSLPNLARSGTAAGRGLDSGDPRTVWHRLYLEASIPAHCVVRVRVAVSQEAGPPSVNSPEWHEHVFGAYEAGTPCGVWLPDSSEIAFHPGLLPCPRLAGRSGLFTVLLQRTGRAVGALTGRYLHVRLELHGTGQATPEVAALRTYASRFSYAGRYLPELYRETQFGPDADQKSECTPADFLDRFLGLFESYLTPLEGRVANAYLLTLPRAAPPEALEWLGRWIGVSFDPAFPEERRREWLESAAELYRWRGTLRGFAMALDIATGGGVRSGEVVIVENFRLRRVLATVLGVELSRFDDPLLPGADYSGNSVVGDSLLLGEESRREFLALFAASLRVTSAEDVAIARLFDELAHRVTVLVHQEVEPRDLGVIRRVAAREIPAHVQLTVAAATLPFLAGISALVGVDTYLSRRPVPGPVRVGFSRVGVWDVVRSQPSLDPEHPA